MNEADDKPRGGLLGRLFGKKPVAAPTPEHAPPAFHEANVGPDAAAPAAISSESHQGESTRESESETGVLPQAFSTNSPDFSRDLQPNSQPLSPMDAETEAPKKQSWFARLKSGLSKTSSKLSEGITSVFTKRKLDGATLEELEDLLIQADLGLPTTQRITDTLKAGRFNKTIAPDEVREVLANEVAKVLEPVAKPLILDNNLKPSVILVVGVNGTGKTTTIGKLAAQFRREGKVVLLAAGDTFRAAAIDQLKIWGERTGAAVEARAVGADSAGLAFDALKRAQAENADVLLIDTAGRLQNKQALMDELEKVVRVIRKIDETAPHHVLLVLDATTGQNALNQVEVFRDRAGVTGLVMTKLDGTARGGILIAIAEKFGLPVHAVGIGEGIDDLQPFDAREFANAIAFG